MFIFVLRQRRTLYDMKVEPDLISNLSYSFNFKQFICFTFAIFVEFVKNYYNEFKRLTFVKTFGMKLAYPCLGIRLEAEKLVQRGTVKQVFSSCSTCIHALRLPGESQICDNIVLLNSL